jgi:hypothetical protein
MIWLFFRLSQEICIIHHMYIYILHTVATSCSLQIGKSPSLGISQHIAIADIYTIYSIAILKYLMLKCMVIPKSTVPFLFVASPATD